MLLSGWDFDLEFHVVSGGGNKVSASQWPSTVVTESTLLEFWQGQHLTVMINLRVDQHRFVVFYVDVRAHFSRFGRESCICDERFSSISVFDRNSGIRPSIPIPFRCIWEYLSWKRNLWYVESMHAHVFIRSEEKPFQAKVQCNIAAHLLRFSSYSSPDTELTEVIYQRFQSLENILTIVNIHHTQT